jgi:hypothetical protein
MQETFVREFRKAMSEKEIPKYYSGWLHLLTNFSLLLGVCGFCLYKVQGASLMELLIVPVTFIIGNLAVFLIHRYPLHRYLSYFPYPYKVHTKSHHHYYTKECYAFESTNDWYMIFFPITVVFLFSVIYIPLNYFIAMSFLSPNATFLYLFTSSLYFISYEVVHFISHVPENALILRLPFLKFMWNHHRTHHDTRLMSDYNFNIVYPLCDLLFGTYYRAPDKPQNAEGAERQVDVG